MKKQTMKKQILILCAVLLCGCSKADRGAFETAGTSDTEVTTTASSATTEVITTDTIADNAGETEMTTETEITEETAESILPTDSPAETEEPSVPDTSAGATVVSDDDIRTLVCEVFPDRNRDLYLLAYGDSASGPLEEADKLGEYTEEFRNKLFNDIKYGSTMHVFDYFDGENETQLDPFTYLELLMSEYPVMTDEQEEEYINTLKSLKNVKLLSGYDMTGVKLACYLDCVGKGDRELLVVITEDEKSLFSNENWMSSKDLDMQRDAAEYIEFREDWCMGYVRADEIMDNVKAGILPVIVRVSTRADERFSGFKWYYYYDQEAVGPEKKALVSAEFGGFRLFTREDGTQTITIYEWPE